MSSSDAAWADCIQRARRTQGLTQEQFARLLGVSFATVNRWERKKAIPRPAMQVRLQVLLDGLERSSPGQPPTSAPREGSARVRERAGTGPAGLPDTAPAASTDGLLPDRTAFIGRESELAQLAELSWSRLLTITGAGGIGKSRLSVEHLRRQDEPVLGIIHLDTVVDPALVAGALRIGIGLPAVASGSELEALTEGLAPQQGVLVLDTCEHVREAVASVTADVLAHAPGVRVLATSQVTLGLPEERILHVRPMDTGPDGDAVALFVERAEARRVGRPVQDTERTDIVRLCERLDGVPLPVVLAAGWMGALTPGQLLEHWDERENVLVDRHPATPRHRGSTDSVAWSAELLDPPARTLVAQLSVFAGPFVLDDVAAVASYPSRTDLISALGELVDRSWVEFEPDSAGVPRYRLLDTLRTWAATELAADGVHTATLDRLTAHVLSLCERAEKSRFASADENWPARLELAMPTIGSVLSRVSASDPSTSAQIAVSLLAWWRMSGRLSEGRHWLALAYTRCSSRSLRARAMCAEALLALDLAQYTDVERLVSACLPDLDAAGDDVWSARALTARGTAASYRGDASAARADLQTAYTRWERASNPRETAIGLNNLGMLASEIGDLAASERFYRASLALKRQVGDERGAALTTANLADVQLRQGAVDGARAALAETLAWARSANDRLLQTLVEVNLGEAGLRADDAADARSHFEVAVATADGIQAVRLQAIAERGLGVALQRLGRHDDAVRHLLVARDIAEQTGDESVLDQVRETMSELVGSALPVEPPLDLSSREVQVIEHLIGGSTNKQIAASLRVKVSTVESHLASIYRKLGVGNRTAATEAARRVGIRSQVAPTPS